jgi:C-terminal processing protease CtpA/Prc
MLSNHKKLLAAICFGLVPWGAVRAERLAGCVVDGDGSPVAAAVVIVCDHQTGIPVSATSYRPFTKEMDYQQIAGAVTDDQGQFEFDVVRPGDYRLIAQSWEDADEPVKQVLEVNGRIVHLRGIVPKITVPSAGAEQVVIRPAGTAVLDITTSPQAPNDETLLVVSRAELAADPVLAFAAWTGPFMPQMLAGNRMPHGRTVVRGMPAGPVSIAAFAADNNPGFGGVRCKLSEGRTSFVSVPLIASWSDGHKQPPEHLRALVEQRSDPLAPSVMELVRAANPEVARQMQAARENSRALGAGLGPFLSTVIEYPPGTRRPLREVLAADAYVRLLTHDRERREKQRQRRIQEMEIDDSVTYEQAFEDLFARLGRDYPCFELKGTDWQAVGARLRPQVKEVQNDRQFGLLCLELVAALQDSHAQLLPAAAPVPEVEFPLWDAGFACLVDDRGEPVVYFVAAESAAARAGLKPGMTVQSVNGIEAGEAIQSTKEHLKRYVGYSSDRYLRYHAYRFFARQQKQGQPIELVVALPNSSEKKFHMRAEHRAGYLPRLPVPIDGIADSGNVSWKMLEEQIGYIYVRRIQADLIESLDAAIKQLASARGLIIDVRGNSGGGFDSRRAFRNFDLEDGAEPSRPRFTREIALLIDARCISAGEGWTSWFVARQRARLFGEATAGASARKTTYTLRNGLFKVRYPVKAYRGSLDRPIERRGLVPDVPLMPRAEDIAAGRDTVLEAAKEWLYRMKDKNM